MEHHQTIRAYSAGGVVYRLTPMQVSTHDFISLYTHNLIADKIESETGSMNVVEVALVGRSQSGIWALPKGTPQSGETVEQVAVREAQEETGLQVRLIAYIGSITYSFTRDQVHYRKQVRHFLLEAIGGDTSLHDHEYDVVEWFPIHEASRHLTYRNEAHILNQAEDMLQRRLEQQYREGNI